VVVSVLLLVSVMIVVVSVKNRHWTYHFLFDVISYHINMMHNFFQKKSNLFEKFKYFVIFSAFGFFLLPSLHML
jgi:hypothetical protein